MASPLQPGFFQQVQNPFQVLQPTPGVVPSRPPVDPRSLAVPPMPADALGSLLLGQTQAQAPVQAPAPAPIPAVPPQAGQDSLGALMQSQTAGQAGGSLTPPTPPGLGFGEILTGTWNEIVTDFERDIPRIPAIGTIKEVPGVIARGISSLFDEGQEPAAPVDTIAQLETPEAEVDDTDFGAEGGGINVEKVVKTVSEGTPQQRQAASAKLWEDDSIATMMLAVGTSLLQGRGIGDAIANGMQALGAYKKQQAAGAAAARAEAREDRKLDLTEREVAVKERKNLAEVKKLQIETKNALKGGNAEDLNKLRVSLWEKISQSEGGLDMSIPEINAAVETTLKQLGGAQASSAAIVNVLNKAAPEDRAAIAQNWIDRGLIDMATLTQIMQGK